MTVSERWQEFDSEPPKLESEAIGEASANGAVYDHAISVAEPIDEEATATDGGLAVDLPMPTELTGQAVVLTAPDDVAADAADDAPADDAPAADAPADDAPADIAVDASVDASADVADDPPAGAADDGSAFLAELVRTMQATAGLERIRIGEAIERRRQERVDEVQARKASEADRMRVLAAEDMAAIEAWVDTETARIKLERERRETAVREDLDTSLAEHASKIDQEIEGIEAALTTYRAEVDAYFEGLDRETDPILIAKRAAMRPVFPRLDPAQAVAASVDQPEAEAESPDEPVVVGVMDPAAAVEPVESWANDASAETSPDATAPEPDEAVPAGFSQNNGKSGGLLQSVPAKRPMSWLWRNED